MSEERLNRLRPIVGAVILGTMLTGLVAYLNKDWIGCQLGGHNRVCPLPLPTIQQQSPQKMGNILYYPYLSVTDSRGRSAEINMAVLSDRYEWQLASSDLVRLRGKTQSLPISALKQELEKQGIFKIMENPNRIVAIGTASCGGAISAEELLALSRAKTIQNQIVKQLFEIRAYPILNLGQFKRDRCQLNDRGNSLQRRLVIIGIRKEDEGLNEKEALYQRLSKTIKDLNLNDYSLGTLDKFGLTL